MTHKSDNKKDRKMSDNKEDKFQDSMRKEAIRLDFAEKREIYKKHMRQASSMTSNKTISSNGSTKIKKNSKSELNLVKNL